MSERQRAAALRAARAALLLSSQSFEILPWLAFSSGRMSPDKRLLAGRLPEGCLVSSQPASGLAAHQLSKACSCFLLMIATAFIGYV